MDLKKIVDKITENLSEKKWYVDFSYEGTTILKYYIYIDNN